MLKTKAKDSVESSITMPLSAKCHEKEEDFAPTSTAPAGEGLTRKARLHAQIAKLEALADCMAKAAFETFETADIGAETPHQAAAMKREAASMGKACASLLLSGERLREIAARADS